MKTSLIYTRDSSGSLRNWQCQVSSEEGQHVSEKAVFSESRLPLCVTGWLSHAFPDSRRLLSGERSTSYVWTGTGTWVLCPQQEDWVPDFWRMNGESAALSFRWFPESWQWNLPLQAGDWESLLWRNLTAKRTHPEVVTSDIPPRPVQESSKTRSPSVHSDLPGSSLDLHSE